MERWLDLGGAPRLLWEWMRARVLRDMAQKMQQKF